MPESRKTVCWISSARYRKPLDATASRKWQLMTRLDRYEIHVIGFSTSLRPRVFKEQVWFYLLPQPQPSLLRYLTIFSLAPLLLIALVLRYQGAIIVAQSPYEGAIGAFAAGIASLLGRRPKLIIENHNNFEEDVFLQRAIPLPGLYRKLMLATARYAFRRADALRVVSSSTAARARHYAPELPQARFMAFSDTEVFRQMERRVPIEAAADIVYAGALIPRKGLHHLLNAFDALDHPRAMLHLVGGAENAAYAASLRRQAVELGIDSRVRFAGAVSQRELASRLSAARVLVLPSLSEGMGRVVVEAMLLDIPVIGSRVGGIPDMITDGVNGYLVEPGDEAELTAALRRIYDDENDVKAMGEKAREFADGFFSPRKHIEDYRQLFELALASARGDKTDGAAVGR
ncbi:MAG: glycosyltransferase family 4 protein [Chloroflexota bacterium]|nr:glycosyltransferase family 4 protein [Chloroflexota bacterium]MDE2910060.1 glycosyltransferase family 4 protein [Chloroflexota bacterium]